MGNHFSKKNSNNKKKENIYKDIINIKIIKLIIIKMKRYIYQKKLILEIKKKIKKQKKLVKK